MEIYGGFMKRSIFLFTLVLVTLLFMIMRHDYLEVVSTSKQQLLSNVKYDENLCRVRGKIIEFNLSNRTFVFAVNQINERATSVNWLIKVKDEFIIQSIIDEGKYHLTIIVDRHQYQYTSAKNQYYFDYDQYLFSNGINGQYYLKDIIQKHADGSLCLSCLRLNIRTWIESYLTKCFSPSKSGFLLALLLGDKSQFDDYERYKNLGLAHVFAISGLHFGIIYQYFRQIIFVKNRWVKSSIIVATMAFMLLLVGGAYSAQRAFFMILYSEIATLLHRKHDIFVNISVSLILILMIKPVAILSTGLHLSYFAYICVAVLYKALFKKKLKYKILEAIRFSIAIQILLLPATLYYFQSANLFGFISNAFIVPLSGVILPLALLLLIIGALHLNAIAYVVQWILNLLIGIFEWIGSWLPLELDYFIHFKKSDFYMLLIYVSIVSMTLIFWKAFGNRKKMNQYAIVGLTLLFITFNAFSHNDIAVTFFDVGHGDMSLIEAYNSRILIDTGDGRVDSNALLRGRGIHHIDILILSHAHNDHIGDVQTLIQSMDVDEIFANQETAHILESTIPGISQKISVITKPTEVVLDERSKQPFVINIMPMIGADINAEEYDPNDDALVTSIIYGDIEGWFLADISGDVMDRYFKGNLRQIDFIKSAHHGSKTSLSETFYADNEITYAFTSCNTKYSMPYPGFEALLKLNNIENYTTYRYGEIQLNLSANDIKIKTFLKP